MKWSDIAGVVGKIAPALGAALGGPAGGAVGALLSSALGVENTPEAVSVAAADPTIAVKLAEIERDKAAAWLNALTAQTAEIQETARAEQASGDEYVRRTRPSLARKSAYVTFGYALVTGVVFQALNAAFNLHLPGPEASIITVMFSPCLAYMGVRTIDAFSKTGKT